MSTLRFGAVALGLLGLSSTAMAVLPTVTADPNAAPDVIPARVMMAPAQPIVFMNGAAPAMPAPVTTPVQAMPIPVTAAPVSNTNNQLSPRVLASIVTRDAQGQEVLSPVTAQTKLVSGNIIEYRGYVTNAGTERVSNMKVTLDIPAGMELTGLPDMAPERPYGSMDGTNFQYMPLKANINGVVQELPMSYYKAVQWDIKGLGLNEVAMVKFRARVK